MITFIIALVLLVVGFFTYGILVEKVFGVEPDRKTPALTKTDGVHASMDEERKPLQTHRRHCQVACWP